MLKGMEIGVFYHLHKYATQEIRCVYVLEIRANTVLRRLDYV